MSKIKISIKEAVNRDYGLVLDGYYFKEWGKADGMSNFHRHSRIELMYVEEGECQIEFFSENSEENQIKKISLSSGSGIFIDSYEWHKLIVNDKCIIINYEFLLQPKKNAVNSLKEIATLSPILNDFLKNFKQFFYFRDNSIIKKVVKILWEEIEKTHGFSDYENVLNMYCNLLLIEIGRCTKQQNIDMKAYSLYVKKALKYIQLHVKEKIRMEDIACEVQVNYAYLERLFKESMGMSLVEYISLKKVELAETLLCNTALSIEMIAKQVGFGSRQQFNNVFKKFKEVSPKKYREKQVDNSKEIWHGFTGGYEFELMSNNPTKHCTDKE